VDKTAKWYPGYDMQQNSRCFEDGMGLKAVIGKSWGKWFGEEVM
jgi:hypothetical protein